VRRRSIRAIDIAYDAQRDAQDVSDAERERSLVRPGQIAIAQVDHDFLLAARKHVFRNLLAGLEARRRER